MSRVLQQRFASDLVMSCDLREQGPKKRERNVNKSVAGDFLVSSFRLCMFGMQPYRHISIGFTASN